MIQIALCGDIATQDDEPKTLIATVADELGLSKPTVTAYSNPTDLVELCIHAPEGCRPPDLVISTINLPGISGLELAHELQRAELDIDGMRFVLCASEVRIAADASLRGIDGFLLEPIDHEELLTGISWILRDLEGKAQSSATLPCRTGVRHVAFSRITYVETVGRDQAVHRLGEREPLVVRCSSRALFSHLAADERFFKVGSSYIVNLDYVSALSLRSGTIELLDGTQAPVPVRLRTALADAICQFAHAEV